MTFAPAAVVDGGRAANEVAMERVGTGSF